MVVVVGGAVVTSVVVVVAIVFVIASITVLVDAVVVVAAFVVIFRMLAQLPQIASSKKIKPEQMALIGFGLGFCGLIGLAIGLYRGYSDRDDEDSNVVDAQ